MNSKPGPSDYRNVRYIKIRSKREARGAVCKRLLYLVFALFNKHSFYEKNYKVETERELVVA